MKNKGALIALFVCATIGLLVYLFKDNIVNFFKPKPTPQTQPAGNPGNDVGGNGGYNWGNNAGGNGGTYQYDIDDEPDMIELDKNKVLKRGSNNAEVQQLQSMINQVLKVKKKTLLVVDGAFGPKTETALYSLIQKKQTTLSQFATLMVQANWKGF